MKEEKKIGDIIADVILAVAGWGFLIFMIGLLIFNIMKFGELIEAFSCYRRF